MHFRFFGPSAREGGTFLSRLCFRGKKQGKQCQPTMSHSFPFLAAQMTPYPSVVHKVSDDETVKSSRVLTAIELKCIFECLDQPLNLKLNEHGVDAMEASDAEHPVIKGLEALKPGLIRAVMNLNIAYDQSNSQSGPQNRAQDASRMRNTDNQAYKKCNRRRAKENAESVINSEFIPIACDTLQKDTYHLPRDIFSSLMSQFEMALRSDERLKAATSLIMEVSKMHAAGTLECIPSELLKTGLSILEMSSSRRPAASTKRSGELQHEEVDSGVATASQDEEALEVAARAGQAAILLLLGGGPAVFSEEALLAAMGALQCYLERVILPEAERAASEDLVQPVADEDDGGDFEDCELRHKEAASKPSTSKMSGTKVSASRASGKVSATNKASAAKASSSKASATKARRRDQAKRRERAEAECTQRAAPVATALCWLADIVRRGPLQDRELLGLSHLCLTALFCDGGEALRAVQHASVAALLAVFSRHPPHRRSIFEELFARIGAWRPLARPEACYRLAAPASGHIQTLSALVLLLLQVCARVSCACSMRACMLACVCKSVGPLTALSLRCVPPGPSSNNGCGLFLAWGLDTCPFEHRPG